MRKNARQLISFKGGYNLLPWLIFVLLGFSSFFICAQSAYRLGAVKFEQNQYDSALYYFNLAVSDSAPSKEAFYNRGLVYYRLQNYSAAIHDFNTSIALDTNFKEAEWMLALTLQKSGQWKKAFTTYQVLDTKYSGYNDSKKRIFYYRLAVFICDNWYYMVAIMFMVIIFVTVVAKTIAYKRG